jgi:DNA repair protein RecN (Recombination protein N)
VLHELRVENLLLMERAELRLAPGLNVLTGETGAGKTLLAHALDLLLGGRARRGIVRQGAQEAYAEGVFALPPDLERGELIPDGTEEIVLARRVWPDGRTRSYVCGRSATLADLRDLGGRLLAFYGQHEHRKLTLSSAQLDILDGHCGPSQLELRARVGHAYERARALDQHVAELRAVAGARDRELDLLRFELEEIESVAPDDHEQTELVRERDRLRHIETLRLAASEAAQAISPDDGGGAADLLASAVSGLERAAAIEPELSQISQRLEALRHEAQELSSELRGYLARIEETAAGGTAELDRIEERLAAFARLERKHGGSIAEVLGHAEHCRARLDRLEHAEDALEAAEADLITARDERDRLAARLSAGRQKAAAGLAAAVRRRLAELAMPDAEFEVRIEPRADGCGPRGADTVELLIAPNPGLPAGPLKEVASGGELSRVMLALLSVAHGEGHGGGAEHAPLLVFDEVDAGIGGHTARAVGEHLRSLAAGRQILCITHLPQVASLAERHFRIEKHGASTTVAALEGDGVVAELVRMMGGQEGDSAASRHARELLKAA